MTLCLVQPLGRSRDGRLQECAMVGSAQCAGPRIHYPKLIPFLTHFVSQRLGQLVHLGEAQPVFGLPRIGDGAEAVAKLRPIPGGEDVVVVDRLALLDDDPRFSGGVRVAA
jgi:hypothetical protein